MTLKELKSRIFVEIQDYRPGKLLPGLNREIQVAGARQVRAFGGFEATGSFLTAIGTQEYGPPYIGFPTDIISIENVWSTASTTDKRELRPISRKEVRTITTGEPIYYYWEANKLGFDRTCDRVITITLDYYSLGAVPVDEDADYLPRIMAADDDSAWNGIVFEVASKYFKRKAIADVKLRGHWLGFSEDYRRQASRARYLFGQEFVLRNRDRSPEVEAPNSFFGRTSDSLVQRIGGDGDIVRIMK